MATHQTVTDESRVAVPREGTRKNTPDQLVAHRSRFCTSHAVAVAPCEKSDHRDRERYSGDYAQ
jgi:hypothetical protein